MSDFIIRVIVRTLNRFWGPEPKLTPRALQTAKYYRSGDDYATRARLYYGDDQY